MIARGRGGTQGERAVRKALSPWAVLWFLSVRTERNPGARGRAGPALPPAFGEKAIPRIYLTRIPATVYNKHRKRALPVSG